jgi:hypothetical protein
VIFFSPYKQLLGWYLGWATTASVQFIVIHLSAYLPALHILDTERVVI